MDNEWVEGVWEHEIPFTTAPGTQWMWPRCFAVGGKTNFWGRSSARFGDIDFRAASLSGAGVDWPLEYKEIAPVLQPRRTHDRRREHRAESAEQSRRRLPARLQFPLPRSHPASRARSKIGVPYLPDRIAQLTQDHAGSPACHFCGACTTGCDTGSFFSTPWRFLPRAEASGNLELRTNALAKNILVDKNGMASGVAYIDRNTGQEVEVRARAVVVAASCLESRADHAEFEVVALAGWHRELERPARPQSVRSPVRRVGERAPAAVARAAAVSPTTSATARLPGCRAGRISRNRTRRNSSHGYSVYPWGGCSEYPWYAVQVEGFGSSYKREVKRRYPTPISFSIQAPSLPSPD